MLPPPPLPGRRGEEALRGDMSCSRALASSTAFRCWLQAAETCACQTAWSYFLKLLQGVLANAFAPCASGPIAGFIQTSCARSAVGYPLTFVGCNRVQGQRGTRQVQQQKVGAAAPGDGIGVQDALHNEAVVLGQLLQHRRLLVRPKLRYRGRPPARRMRASIISLLSTCFWQRLARNVWRASRATEARVTDASESVGWSVDDAARAHEQKLDVQVAALPGCACSVRERAHW